MLLLIFSSLILLQVNYYYHTADGCIPCQRQLPIIQRLQREGFDFEIIKNSDKVEVYPTIIIELIDYKNLTVKEIKLEGFQSYPKLLKWVKRNDRTSISQRLYRHYIIPNSTIQEV